MGATGGWTGAGSGPSLSSVELAGSVLRVHFDEEMTPDSNFLSAGNYTLTPTGGGDAVTVLSVDSGPGSYPTYSDLTLSGLMTSGSPYDLDVDSSLIDAVGNPMDAGGLSISFYGLTPAYGTPLGEQGLIQAVIGAIAESDAEIGGHRITRLAAVANPGDSSVQVETTLDWPDAGSIAIGGIRYNYAGKTVSAFTGLTHVEAGATISGIKNIHRIESPVADISKEWSALEKLRRAMLVEYAEGDDLNAIGRNLGVNRLPIFEDDDQFREAIKVMAYNPKGTYWGLEQALTGLVGAGNFEIVEDMLKAPNTVFIRLLGASMSADEYVGKTFMNYQGYGLVDDGGIGQDKVPVPPDALTIGSVRLHTLNELFDLADVEPSLTKYDYYPGVSAPQDAFTYQGSELESQVTHSPGEYTLFESPSTGLGSVYYRMTDAQGARVTPDSYAEINGLFQIEEVSGILESGVTGQCSLAIFDGAVKIQVGVDSLVSTDQYELGLYNAAGSFISGASVVLYEAQYYDVAIRKYGQSYVELIIDGQIAARVAYSEFTASTTDHAFEFGIRSGRITGGDLRVRYKRLGVFARTPTDYWALQASGSVSSTTPNRLTISAGGFVAGDAGKRVLTLDSGVTNPGGGNNNGAWTIEAYVDTNNVDLVGDTWEDAYVESVTPNRIYLDSRELTFPDDLGKKIVIEGGTYAGTYTINDLMNPDNPTTSLGSFDTPLRTKTHVCEVVSGGFVGNESGLGVHLEPNFATEASLAFDLSDAGELTGTSPNQVADLRQSLWNSDLVMAIAYSVIESAQALPESQILNNLVSAGPPPVFSYYPFYVNDPLGLVQAYLDTVTAAGVIPEYLIE